MRKKPRLHPSFQPSIYNKRRRANLFIRNTDGVAAIEFAIVLPVFLTLAMGIITYGLYFGAAHSTAQLAADAARASVAGLSDSERTLIAQQHIEINAKEYVLVDPTSISVEAGPLSSDASQFRVSIRYDTNKLPIWNLVPFVPLPNKIITRTSTIKRGGF